ERLKYTRLLMNWLLLHGRNVWPRRETVSWRMRRTQRRGSTIVLFATSELTAPTKAMGASDPRNRLANTRIFLASTFGRFVTSGGRKNSKPVEPPMLMA